MDLLSHEVLVRPEIPSSTATDQRSVDFTVIGASLLTALLKTSGVQREYMGCFVSGFPEQNAQAAERLIGREPPDSESGRVLLYLCPVCGDIGCGAYSAFIERVGDVYVWRDFAYENGYEEPKPISGVGPSTFERSQYEAEVARASAL